MANTYDTSLFPLGSTEIKVLYNNAGNADLAVNSDALTWQDRPPFNRTRKTWRGIETDASNALLNTGFEFIGDYVTDGPLTITRFNQTFSRSGEFWRAGPSLTLPFTTTGNWVTDGPNFVSNGDASIRSALANSVNPLMGAALVARGDQVVTSIAELKTLSKNSVSHSAFLSGIGGGPFQLDSSDTTTPGDDGYVVVAADGGRWKRPWTGVVSPFEYGAAGNGTADDRLKIRAAIAKIRAMGGGSLDVSGGTFALSGPEQCYQKMHICGTGVITSHTSFVADVSFPTYITNIPQVYNCLLYVNEGTHADDPNNFGWLGFTIEPGVKIFGGYRVDNGLIMEGITNYSVAAEIAAFNAFGVWAKYYCWGGDFQKVYIHDCRIGLLKLGEAANGVSLAGGQFFGGADTPTYGIQVIGDNNGIDLSGAFVEKCVNNLFIGGFNGPFNISGVDFEDSTAYCITVDGTGTPGGRAAGPVVISGSFLEAPQSCVLAINAIVHVTGCRLRDSAVGFTADGQNAVIYETGNTIESTVIARSSGNVVSDYVTASSRKQINHVPNPLGSYVDSYLIGNNNYYYNETIQTSGLVFKTAIVDAPTQRMLSSSVWTTSEMRAGALYGSLGVILDYTAGTKNFGPIENASHYCGYSGSSWAGGSTVVAFTVTSDARKKQQVRDLSESESAVASRLKKMIKSFKLNTQVAEHGDKAKIHIGVIAQEVISAFEAEGLNGLDYAIVNYDEWEASDSVEAGSLYSVNYEQLLAFIISAM
jgi:hypothetical protein